MAPASWNEVKQIAKEVLENESFKETGGTLAPEQKEILYESVMTAFESSPPTTLEEGFKEP